MVRSVCMQPQVMMGRIREISSEPLPLQLHTFREHFRLKESLDDSSQHPNLRSHLKNVGLMNRLRTIYSLI